VQRDGHRDQSRQDQELTAPAEGGEELRVQREHGNHAGRVNRVEDPHRERELAAGKCGGDEAGEQQVDDQAADPEQEPADKEGDIARGEGEDQRAEPHQGQRHVAGCTRRPAIDGRADGNRKQNRRHRDGTHQNADREVAETESGHQLGDQRRHRKEGHADGEEADDG